MLLSLDFLTSLFYYIPKSALAAVIIMAVAPLFDAKILRTLWRVKSMYAHSRWAASDMASECQGYLLSPLPACSPTLDQGWGIVVNLGENTQRARRQVRHSSTATLAQRARRQSRHSGQRLGRSCDLVHTKLSPLETGVPPIPSLTLLPHSFLFLWMGDRPAPLYSKAFQSRCLLTRGFLTQ